MIKRIITLLLALFICVSVPLCVSAELNEEFLIDEADILTDSEESSLRTKLDEISKKYNAQISVITISELEDVDIDEFIEYIYDEEGYGYGENHDGVMFMICMNPREFRILSNGFAGDAISLDTIERITDEITPYLSNGDYAKAFDAFLEDCDYYINGHLNGFPFDSGKNLLIAIAIGLVAAWIVTSAWKGQLKSVRKQERANEYVKPGSLQITQSYDFFLYSHVTKTEKQQNKSSSSGGGSSRNVGGGSF